MAIIDNKYSQWKARLLDLSKRNRLLYFKEFKRSSVRLVEPDGNQLFKSIVQEGKKLVFAQSTSSQISFDSVTDSSALTSIQNPALLPLRSDEIRTNQNVDSLGTTLYNLRSRTRSALEEQGVNILFLAFGMLKWYESNQSKELIQTPLILVPVDLDRPSVVKPYTIELAEDDPLLNPTLAYKLQNDFHLTLPALPDDWTDTSLNQILGIFSSTIRTQTNWSISPDVVLGLFSFEKLVMLKDLESYELAAKKHSIVMGLGGDRSSLESDPSDLPSAEELDSKIKPADTFQVLDADSSQQETIAQAKRGVSLVIQGPPGTGKSQTIANLIAELLAQNKRVLFVSEKQAALDVVYGRLANAGLGEFCLKAHGHKANKTEVLSQLERALQNYGSTTQPSTEDLATVSDVRTQLNHYVTLLHTPITALQKTPYSVHGLLAGMSKAPDLNFVLNSVETIDRTRLNIMTDAVATLTDAASAWQNYTDHPWRNTPVRNFSFQLQNDVQFSLSEGADAANKIATTRTQLASTFDLPKPGKLQHIQVFSDIVSHSVKSPSPLSDWFDSAKLQAARKTLSEAEKAQQEFLQQESKLQSLTTKEFLEFPDLDAMRLRFERDYANFLRIFRSSYKDDMQRIQTVLKTPHKLRYGEARTLVELGSSFNKTKYEIKEHEQQWQEALGHYYQGNKTDWRELESGLAWTEKCLKLLGTTPITPTYLGVVCVQPDRLRGLAPLAEHLATQLTRLADSFSKLKDVLPPEKLKFNGLDVQQAEFTEVQKSLEAQLAQVNRLEEWIHFEEARSQLEKLELGTFVKGVLDSQPNPQQLKSAFLKRFYHIWLDFAYAKYPTLQIRGEQHNRQIEQFKKSDENQLEIAKGRVQAQLRSKRPNANLSTARTSEVSILRKELQRKRHRPIRRIFGEIPNLLVTLTPCLMMSPLSVSMFLSGAEFAFDTVIFDEASQIVPEDAIASIMRGKQVIVAGDSNQLPPTSFFRAVGIEQEDENEEVDSEILESILQECSTFLKTTHLKWHYRSRHESLIAFSNQEIYKNRLVTFPSVVQSAAYLGVEFVHVPNGVYDRGYSRTNRIEAARVAELVFEHFTNHPDQTLGVVAFSMDQKHAIEEEVERKLRRDLSYEKFLDPKGPGMFFVKNLESVQGDERDVMFFSVGYGKASDGRLTMNFGPLNGESGVRRLNVAITRARLHVKLISSIVPEDMNLTTIGSRGIHLLKAYMEYTRAGGSADSLRGSLSLDPNAESESPFEESVYRELSNRGLLLHKQVGCSGFRIDMAVVDPKQQGRYLLGIECDGATYHSAKTARDRDRLRQQVLEGLGWKILRIWSRDWLSDSNYQTQRVLNALNQNPIPAETRSDQTTFRTNDLSVQMPQSVPPPSTTTQASTRNLRPQAGRTINEISTRELGRAVVTCLEREFSLSEEELITQTARFFGFSRTGERIRQRISEAIRQLDNAKQIRKRNDKFELTR